QPGLLEDGDGARANVVDGGGVAARLQPLARLRPPGLRPVPQREQGFLAAQLCALARDLHDLVALQVQRVRNLAGDREDSAVVTPVATQPGQRDEDRKSAV